MTNFTDEEIEEALEQFVKEGKLVKRWNDIKKVWEWQTPPKLTK